MAMTLEQFIEAHGGYWKGAHPKFSLQDWLAEVNNGDTLKGYWDWAFAQAEGEPESPTRTGHVPVRHEQARDTEALERVIELQAILELLVSKHNAAAKGTAVNISTPWPKLWEKANAIIARRWRKS